MVLGVDEGKSHTYKLERALYLPESHANIIISTALSDHYDDYEGTYIKTKRHRSVFSWNLGQHMRTITHSANCLDGIPINYGYEVFGVFLSRMKSQMDPNIYFSNCYYMNQIDTPDVSQLT